MKYLVIFLVMSVITLISNNVIAEQTQFKQQILPINCVYEVIDVGTQKLRYITPDTCPIDPGPPVITEPPFVEVSTTDTINTNVPTKKPIYNLNFATITVRPPNIINNEQNDVATIPRVAGVIERIIKSNDIVAILSFIVIIGWLLIALRIYKNQKQQE